MLVACLS